MDSTAAQAEGIEVPIERIMQMIPHRYPMLLIDRVIKAVPGVSATGVKNVTINEPFFQGHFPGKPVMPGVLIVEAMAQTAGVVVVHALGPEAEGKLVYFLSIDGVRFRKPVVPGDIIHIHVVKQRQHGSVWKFSGHAHVGDVLVAEATIAAMILQDDK